MVFAIQVAAFFRNTARRDNALNQLNTRFQQDPQWGTPETRTAVSRAGDPGVRAIARFVNQADRDSLWNNLDAAFGTGVNGPVAGSVAFIHNCQHDADIGACTIAQLRTW